MKDSAPPVGLAAAVLALSLALSGCPSGPPERPPSAVGQLSDAEVIDLLHRRTQAVDGVLAELGMAYDGPERRGTLDALVLYQAQPRALRIVAYKDLVVADRPVFEILFGVEDYACEIDLGSGQAPTRQRGSLADFPGDVPRFAGFYWAGPALFLGGAVFEPATTRVERGQPGQLQVSTRLPTGAEVTWQLDDRTLAPRSGTLLAPDGRRLELRYAEVSAVEHRGVELLLPGSVIYADPAEETRVEMSLSDEPTLAPELEPDAFDPATVGE